MGVDVSFLAPGFITEAEAIELSFLAPGFITEAEAIELSFLAPGFLTSEESNPSVSSRRRQAMHGSF